MVDDRREPRATRRDALRLMGGGTAAFALSRAAVAAETPAGGYHLLSAAPATARLGAQSGPTDVWAYGGKVPGPVLRVRQGATLKVRLRNGLTQGSTVHWHGIRIDNAMDGVAGLTQPAVPPGETFDYAFKVPDAGTFWYHPHNRSWEQVARGLYGALVVEEPEPPSVDHDRVLVFDDWRLDRAGQIDEASLGHMMDWSHAGRLGNWLTVNGRSRPTLTVKKGERWRLRLLNAANARVMTLAFPGHVAQIVALDGQPVAPHAADGGRIVLAPGMRADVILDMGLDPGARSAIEAVSGQVPLDAVRIVYDAGIVKRESPLAAPVRLPANPLATKLDLATALIAPVVMEGGAMGGMGGGMRGGMMGGRRHGMREMMSRRMAWSLNGVAGRPDKPFVEVPRGRTAILRMVNDTAWPHAMHLHGHHFKAVARNGRPVRGAPWRDTELLQRGEKVDVAFVADNPGKWLLHCHMLEHHAAGMVTWLNVS